jgi:Fe-S-cluster containining protein
VPSLEQLCLACGLCCDGTLFDNVRLEPSDQPKKLKALGLPVVVSRGKEPITTFAQPCAALCQDRTCLAYADRPKQCRTYECMVYQGMEAGRIAPDAALRLVTRARRQADRVRKQLRQLGDTEEHRSLGERFHRMQERMEANPGDAEALARFADLSLAVHRLKLLAHAKFHVRAEDVS